MADQRAGQLQQSEVKISPAFPPGAQSLVGMEPRETAFDDPPVLPQAGTVRSPAAGDPWGDAPGSQ